MGLFRKKQDRVIDLTEHYRKQQAQAAEMQAEASDVSSEQSQKNPGSGGFFGGFFGGPNNENSSNASPEQETSVGETVNVEEKRRKLARRLKEMTEKLEDLSNQIYHLQQRIEVLEKRSGIGGY